MSDTNKYSQNQLLNIKLSSYTSANWTVAESFSSNSLSNGMAMYYEPTLKINNPDSAFIPKYMDSTGAVFGFLYRHPAFLAVSVP